MAENKDLEEYKVSTMEDEEDYFDNVEMELDYSISITEGSMELGKDNIKEQKKVKKKLLVLILYNLLWNL